MNFMRVFIPVLFLFITLLGVTRSFFQINTHERLVVYRLGKPVGVRGPGRVMLIPFLETGVRYNMEDEFDAKLVTSLQTRF